LNPLVINTIDTRGRFSYTFYTKKQVLIKEVVEMESKKAFTEAEAKQIGNELGIKWNNFSVDQFRRGVNVELEHGSRNKETNVTNDDRILTGKIALAHLNEFPDYYDRLEKMEKEADKFWGK